MSFLIAQEQELVDLRRLRTVSLIEGTTLLFLLLVAVPLKHLGGLPIATKIMGPIHGLAFVSYVWMLVSNLSGADWTRRERLQMVLAAVVPLGAFINERVLARREAALAIQLGG